MQSLNISALPGQPSTFWKSDSGLWYTSKALAEKDDNTKAVNPDDYAIRKGFFAKYKYYIITAAVILLLALAYAVKTGKLKFRK